MGITFIFLYTEVMGYTLAGLRALARISRARIILIGWDKKKLTPFKVDSKEGIEYYGRSYFQSYEVLFSFCQEAQPSAIYVSGRMDKWYLKIAKYFKGTKIPIVTGFDNQWKNTIRQNIAVLFSYFIYHRYFDYIWIAGIQQYEYARRLNFSERKILSHVYTADVSFFSKAYYKHKEEKSKKFPHTFLFVGRFVPVKGLDVLIKAFEAIKAEIETDWKIILVGNGVLKNTLPIADYIEVKDFLQPAELIRVVRNGGVFCLPSKKEAWGVVIHEFAAAGMPIVVSDACGAATAFVKSGYNGYTFESDNPDSLKNAMHKIIDTEDKELLAMGQKSNLLAQHINPEIWACSFLNSLEKQ